MLTPFGQAIRQLRIEHSHLLYDMAKYLGYSSAQLSSIENGRLAVPPNMISRIADWYDLGTEEIQKLQSLAKLGNLG